MKKVMTIAFLSILLISFQNCSGPRMQTLPLNNVIDAASLSASVGGGGTTVGDPKPSVSYGPYNDASDPTLPPVVDVRLCMQEIRLYYNSLNETPVADAYTTHRADKKAIVYKVASEVRFRPEGSPIANMKIYDGNYSKIEIYVRSTGYFNNDADCSFKWSPYQVTNGFGTFELDGIYWARSYDLNTHLSANQPIELPVQKLIDNLQIVKSSQDLYDAFDKAEGIWPQKTW